MFNSLNTINLGKNKWSPKAVKIQWKSGIEPELKTPATTRLLQPQFLAMLVACFMDAMIVFLSVSPPLWFGLKISTTLMDCDGILYRHTWSLEGMS